MVKQVVQLLIAMALCCAFTGAQQLKPLPGTSVHDFANVLSAESEKQLQEKARRLKEEFNTEIAVVTLQSLNGEEVFDYSLKLAREWGIGSKDNEVRGILLLLAIQERKFSIRTSRHIEGELPDGVTGEINRQAGSYFKNGDFAGGLDIGLGLILSRLQEVYAPPQTHQSQSGGSRVWLWWLLGCTTVSAMAFLLIRRSRRRARETERRRALTVAETRNNYFAIDNVHSRQTGQKTRQQKQEKKEKRERELSERQQELLRKQQQQQEKRLQKEQRRAASRSPEYDSSSSAYEPSSSSSSSSDHNSYNDYGSSSSYDSGSSSDSGSSYSGGSDFGGGGSDSSW
jgi:uncharacterized membrane protein YgcG